MPPMKTFSTARTRPRYSSGVIRGTSVARMFTLTASAALPMSNATNATAYIVVSPSTIVASPKIATTKRSSGRHGGRTGRAARTTVVRGGADAHGGAEPSEPGGSDPQPFVGDGREQGDGATEEDGEQVERDRSEQQRSPADEPEPVERVPPMPGPRCAAFEATGGRWVDPDDRQQRRGRPA